jgi:hypothetical protein
MRKLLLVILTTISLNCYAQGFVSFSGTMAENYLDNLHGNLELLGGYNNGNCSFNIGASLYLNTTSNRFEALQAQVAYLIDIPKFPLEIRTGYLFLPHLNTSIQEHIWHLQASYMHPHVEVTLGYLIRTYSSENTLYYEFNDFIYGIKAYVWERGNQYNIEFAISNFNDLNIERSINPHIRTRISYAYPRNLRYFVEGLYGGAGIGNIYFEHYQWRVKLGLIWNI